MLRYIMADVLYILEAALYLMLRTERETGPLSGQLPGGGWQDHLAYEGFLRPHQAVSCRDIALQLYSPDASLYYVPAWH